MNIHTAIIQPSAPSAFDPSNAYTAAVAQYCAAKVLEDAAETDEGFSAAADRTLIAMGGLLDARDVNRRCR